MSDISSIWQGCFAGTLATSIGKIMNKNEFLKRGEHLLQDGILNFAISLSRISKLQFTPAKINDFLKRGGT